MEETARAIATKLREHNHIAFFAGGCVRDMVRNLPPKDIDIATDARPEEVQKLFPRTYAVGAHFGVIVVLKTDSSSKSLPSVPTTSTWTDVARAKFIFHRRRKMRGGAISPSTECFSIRRKTK